MEANKIVANIEEVVERTYDRRLADIEDKIDTKTRIAVLEKIAENHEVRIADIEDFHRMVVERLDQKIQLDATNQVIIERTLTKAVTSIETMSDNLKMALEVAREADKLASKHETIGSTVLKVAGWITVIASGAWALFKYFIGA